MSVLQKLTEGIVERSLQKEGAALLEKWEATGLLEGLDGDQNRAGMARLLENQASQLLKEASSMGAGDVEGFASVAFPIVRRVFAGLLANDLVSVQPMSLPSGLIFFLDFVYSGETNDRFGLTAGESLYGGGVVGKNLISGTTDITEEGGGFYNLANHYAHASGTIVINSSLVSSAITGTIATLTEAEKKLVRYDVDLLNDANASTRQVAQVLVPAASIPNLNRKALGGVVLTTGSTGDDVHVRRLNQLTGSNPEMLVMTFLSGPNGGFETLDIDAGAAVNADLEYPLADEFQGADALGALRGSDFPMEGASDQPGSGFAGSTTADQIPEIDIKVDSTAVTAMTKKLKAKWSPELGQDLNAYHNLDAEVELTQILSEQIALEIDREIVNDLVQGATAGTYYWSRSPGLFVNRVTGEEIGASSAAPDFTGTVSEWYETLIETINDVSAQIHRKTLRGGANYLVTSPEVANILEFTAGFRANVTHDADKGTVGAVNVGSISRKFDVHVDPYFPRNLILVGRKGGSFLESGYVYAPYVPLQVTPTIFGVEDFVPRKGVMTRYAKKMVRPDMYGLVVCRGLLGESGS